MQALVFGVAFGAVMGGLMALLSGSLGAGVILGAVMFVFVTPIYYFQIRRWYGEAGNPHERAVDMMKRRQVPLLIVAAIQVVALLVWEEAEGVARTLGQVVFSAAGLGIIWLLRIPRAR